MSDLQESLLCQVGMLERGDIIKYEKYGKEMEGIFIGSIPDSIQVVVRKTAETTDRVPVDDIIENTGRTEEDLDGQ